MKERPILFSTPMVKAILAGTKTQTRRMLKDEWQPLPFDQPAYVSDALMKCPYGIVGDRLWVRETFCILDRDHWCDSSHGPSWFDPTFKRVNSIAYAADTLPGSEGDDIRKEYGYKWKPSIFMPRYASRILLEITGVRIERLNDISDADAIAEGIEPVIAMGTHKTYVNYAQGLPAHLYAKDSYASLWNKINGPGSWEANPWVWCVEFVHSDDGTRSASRNAVGTAKGVMG